MNSKDLLSNFFSIMGEDQPKTTVPAGSDVKMKISGFKWNNLVQAYLNVLETGDKEKDCLSQLNDTFARIYDIDAKSSLSIPNRMDLFTDLDITEKDRLFVNIPDELKLDSKVLFVNGDNNIVGVFEIVKSYDEGKQCNYLVASAQHINFSDHKSVRYHFLFCGSNSKGICLYRVPIEVGFNRTEQTSTHLCIDFGTSNTTAGCFLDEGYCGNISNLAVINRNVKLNSKNEVIFLDKEKIAGKDFDLITYKKILPSVVYIKDCSNPNDIKYAFGYEATRRIKEDNYCPNASCFMEIKRWISNLDVKEDIQDSDGNKAVVSRKHVIAEFLLYVIRAAQNQFKCRFKNIHISVPVKLKGKVLDFYDEILGEYGYTVEKQHAIDEGVAVLYSIIDNKITQRNYENGKSEKALIIDCGGGTSDLASCEYTIEKDDDGIINLDIKTQYMNGDVNFGGNNLTYRIMQYMKIVYARQIIDKTRQNIDELINIDTSALFSFIEGEVENEDDSKVKERYDEVYRGINQAYAEAEKVIPTRFSEYESQTKNIYDKVKNNFFFLWKLAEEMKKEFYRSTSISRYTFIKDDSKNLDIDLHVGRIENWRLSSITKEGALTEQSYPDITFTAKEIDKLLRADIYYLLRKFLNDLYMNNSLSSFRDVKLSGQSSKINLFMDSMKEFVPGKQIKSSRINSKGNDAEELKLLCLNGAIMYLHSLEMSNIEVSLESETRNIPISVYIKTPNDGERLMIEHGDNWEQRAKKGRITTAAKYIYLYMRSSDIEIREPYIYPCDNIEFNRTTFDEIRKDSFGLIGQEELDDFPENRKYFFVYLNKDKWGFNIMPLMRDGNNWFKGNEEFCSFEMDILQESFFDGRK